MNMFPKSTIAKTIALFCSLTAMPTLAADLNFYGKANLSAQITDDGQGSYSEVKSNSSRLGVSGSEQINEYFDVVFKAEFGIDMDGDSPKGDSITNRNQYIGLRGIFGEALIGNNDTMVKQSQGKVDVFSDYNGDIKKLFAGENRMSETIAYKTPKFNDWQLGGMYVSEGSVDKQDAYSFGVFYGDKTLKKSKLYAALAVDDNVKGFDTIRLSMQTKIADFILGAMLQQQENSQGIELDGYLLSVKYKINDFTVKGQYQLTETEGEQDQSAVSVGLDYRLLKSTKLYSFYTNFDMQNGIEQQYFALGIDHKF